MSRNVLCGHAPLPAIRRVEAAYLDGVAMLWAWLQILDFSSQVQSNNLAINVFILNNISD